MRARVFKFYIHRESGQVYCGKKNQDAEIYVCLLFPSLQRNTLGNTVPRILKFSTNVGYDLYFVTENEPLPSCIPFICPFFFPAKFSVTDFLLWEPVFHFLYTPWEWARMLWERKPRCCDSFLPSFSISHYNVICREICQIFLKNLCFKDYLIWYKCCVCFVVLWEK